jgi:hypothetical protein
VRGEDGRAEDIAVGVAVRREDLYYFVERGFRVARGDEPGGVAWMLVLCMDGWMDGWVDGWTGKGLPGVESRWRITGWYCLLTTHHHAEKQAAMTWSTRTGGAIGVIEWCVVGYGG